MLRRKLWTWLSRRKIERLPTITVKAAANYYKTFTAPNPDYKASINNAAGELVGTATYAVSPLSDRVYLFNIEVMPNQRRHGYATALLWYLAQTHGHPITAVKELHGAASFWASARRLQEVGIIVTEPLSVGEMDKEAARWQHLQPEAERLEKLIVERLSVHREPWHIATGRGLEN